MDVFLDGNCQETTVYLYHTRWMSVYSMKDWTGVGTILCLTVSIKLLSNYLPDVSTSTWDLFDAPYHYTFLPSSTDGGLASGFHHLSSFLSPTHLSRERLWKSLPYVGRVPVGLGRGEWEWTRDKWLRLCLPSITPPGVFVERYCVLTYLFPSPGPLWLPSISLVRERFKE